MQHIEYALITGASKGIGKEMAKQLANKGYHLLLVSRNLIELKKTQAEIKEKIPNLDQKIEIFSLDLSLPNAAEILFEFTESHQLTIEVLINNAGFGIYEKIENMEINRCYQMIMLNIYTLTCLCTFYAKAMQKRGSGSILNIASLAAYQPIPYLAAYAATKSYVLNFSEAIALELKEYGITVSCFSPGHTKTNFFKNANIAQDHKFYGIKTRALPEKVAQEALNSLFSKKLSCIYGIKNNIIGLTSKIFPRKMTVNIVKFLVS